MMVQMNLQQTDLQRQMSWVNTDYVTQVSFKKNTYPPDSGHAPLYVVVAQLVRGAEYVTGDYSTEDPEQAFRMLRILGCQHPDDPYVDEEPF